MCHWPEDPNVSNHLLLFFFSFLPLFNILLPITYPLFYQKPLHHFFPSAPIPRFFIHPSYGCFFHSHNFAVQRGMRSSCLFPALYFLVRWRPEHRFEILSIRLHMESYSDKEQATYITGAVCIERIMVLNYQD